MKFYKREEKVIAVAQCGKGTTSTTLLQSWTDDQKILRKAVENGYRKYNLDYVDIIREERHVEVAEIDTNTKIGKAIASMSLQDIINQKMKQTAKDKCPSMFGLEGTIAERTENKTCYGCNAKDCTDCWEHKGSIWQGY